MYVIVEDDHVISKAFSTIFFLFYALSSGLVSSPLTQENAP